MVLFTYKRKTSPPPSPPQHKLIKPTDEQQWFMLMKYCDEMEIIKPETEEKIQDIEDKVEQFEVLINFYNKKGKKWDNSVKDERAVLNAEKFEKLKKKAQDELSILNKQYEELITKYDSSLKKAKKLRVELFKKGCNPIMKATNN